MSSGEAAFAVLLLAIAACSEPDVAPPPADAGLVFVDAGDAPSDAGESQDAGSEPDAGETLEDAGEPPVDAGTEEPVDGGWYEIPTNRPHWKLSFADEFKGPQGRPDDAYCYDELPPQCLVWGGGTNHCDLSDVQGAGFYPPTKPNLVAALRLLEPSRDYAAMTETQVKTLYGSVIGERLRNLNKCNWSIYQMLNWMATDYQGRYSARFDATQVKVDPSGRGHLELWATHAPVEAECIYGGQSFGGPNCLVHAFAAGVLRSTVSYRVDANAPAPGVLYAQVGGACPHGGDPVGSDCRVHAFARHEVEAGVSYWVDTDPRWPGVYYANTAYACRDNIDYEPLGFRNLTCPILNGGLMSQPAQNRPWVDPVTGESRLRGFSQRRGRFEVKSRMPKGVGSFPAAWLMPVSGGWPYDGGEIDVVEARDAADEVYQTYHHGYCLDPATNQRLADVPGPAECQAMGKTSVNFSKGHTLREVNSGEFWKRDHLFAVEWDEDELRYFVNGRHTHTVKPGVSVTLHPDRPGAPKTLESSNLPERAFFWILNHSTWVPPDKRAGFVPQVHRIDYVRTYEQCRFHAEFCPCGGEFEEGVGCVWRGGPLLSCPPGVTLPPLDGDVYPAFCQPASGACVNGGVLENGRCVVHRFAEGQLNRLVSYWVDADPRWPGVYYAKEGGACHHGGSGTVNCRIVALGSEVVETGVDYTIDQRASPPVVSYVPDFAP